MYFREWILSNFLNRVLIMLFAALISFTALSKEDTYSDYTLLLKPQECVSLYQGQTCHLTLSFTFSAPVTNDYCIYAKETNDAIHCWSQKTNGIFSKEFATDKEITFELRIKDNADAVFASTNLSLSWVYKAPNKKRLAWRLF